MWLLKTQRLADSFHFCRRLDVKYLDFEKSIMQFFISYPGKHCPKTKDPHLRPVVFGTCCAARWLAFTSYHVTIWVTIATHVRASRDKSSLTLNASYNGIYIEGSLLCRSVFCVDNLLTNTVFTWLLLCLMYGDVLKLLPRRQASPAFNSFQLIYTFPLFYTLPIHYHFHVSLIEIDCLGFSLLVGLNCIDCINLLFYVNFL